METEAPSARYPSPVRPGRTRVGWIGVGFIGAHMAARLQSAGYSLSVFARTPSKALPLIQAGARLAASPADLARHSDVVFTIVSHPSDVRSLTLGPDGLLSAGPGLVVVDMTTSFPALAREIAAAARSRGCWAVDAPVSGADAGAKEGRLAIFAGGEEGVVEWLTPLFEIMGKPARMGGAGCGQHAKLANQIVGVANLLGMSEALVFAGRAGLDPGAFLAAVRAGAAGSRLMELFGEKMVARDFAPGGFSEYLVKDLGMALTTEEEEEDRGGDGGGGRGGTALVLPGAALCRQLFQAMVANGDGKMGIHGVLTVLERINNDKKDPERYGTWRTQSDGCHVRWQRDCLPVHVCLQVRDRDCLPVHARLPSDRDCLPVHARRPSDRDCLSVHARRPSDRDCLPVHATFVFFLTTRGGEPASSS